MKHSVPESPSSSTGSRNSPSVCRSRSHATLTGQDKNNRANFAVLEEDTYGVSLDHVKDIRGWGTVFE